MKIEVTGQIVRDAMGEYLTSALPSSLGWVVCDGAIRARDAMKRECDRQMWEAVADLGVALRDKLRGYEDATYEATKGEPDKGGAFTGGLAACIRGLALVIKEQA